MKSLQNRVPRTEQPTVREDSALPSCEEEPCDLNCYTDPCLHLQATPHRPCKHLNSPKPLPNPLPPHGCLQLNFCKNRCKLSFVV